MNRGPLEFLLVTWVRCNNGLQLWSHMNNWDLKHLSSKWNEISIHSRHPLTLHVWWYFFLLNCSVCSGGDRWLCAPSGVFLTSQLLHMHRFFVYEMKMLRSVTNWNLQIYCIFVCLSLCIFVKVKNIYISGNIRWYWICEWELPRVAGPVSALTYSNKCLHSLFSIS